jgi:phosphopentomutase
MIQAAPGKDTLSGHWELMGVVPPEPFPTYPAGFPQELLARMEKAMATRFLGNRAASGTSIIQELGAEHIATGYPILYTSADSVLQIAAHEEVIPRAELYRLCEIARNLSRVGRVIARPFQGQAGEFVRTAGRRDWAMLPPAPTLLDQITAARQEVWAVGKVEDLFAGRGIGHSLRRSTNAEVAAGFEEAVRMAGPGLVLGTFPDTDTVYGHRNDPDGFARELERIDSWLGRFHGQLGPEDWLFVTADHGCDPTGPSTDHTREYVPVLVPRAPAVDLGTRTTMCDLAATVAELLDVPRGGPGHSFAAALLGSREGAGT